MKIKTLTILLYILAGLLIAIFTAVMTYIIIGKPIKMPMVKQILTVIASVAPAIGILSYFFSSYLSKKFIFIQKRLNSVKEQDFAQDNSHSTILEIDEINQNINYLSNKMESALSDLKTKNKTLSELLIAMAHDIKTPLTITLGHIEEIEDEIIDKSMIPSTLNSMKKELHFIDEITVDMLEYIESISKKRKQNHINIHNIIEEKIVPILPKKNSIEYINGIDKDLTIYFNCTDFKRIAINILVNAIKFTENGYIKIYNNGKTIFFENTGKAIDMEHKNTIFNPFYTIDKSKNRKNSGFGLGLSIVQNLAKSNNYICSLHNSNQEKTVFKITPIA